MKFLKITNRFVSFIIFVRFIIQISQLNTLISILNENDTIDMLLYFFNLF